MFEFHISRQARNLYQFDQALFATDGNVVFTNLHAARLFAQKINEKRDLSHYPERAVRSGEINALGMIDEIMHLIIRQYEQLVNPQALLQAYAYMVGQLGEEAVDKVLRVFLDEFPPTHVYRQEMLAEAYLNGITDGIPNRVRILEEMLLLWVTNENPAAREYDELLDDAKLRKTKPYLPMIAAVQAYFDTQPPFGPDRENLVLMLQRPAKMSPNSLSGQLDFIRRRWSMILGSLLNRLLGSLDLIQEEQQLRFGGPGPAQVTTYLHLLQSAETEVEHFSADSEWMPRLVMIAKNTYVWLDQLARAYGTTIERLDQIPDEELDTLASRGFTGLWLIGLWERSQASKSIKQMMGNADAEASAYSLAGYEIANDLGGNLAYQNLRERAWQRGIRLASDMVPNHMGIDSSWVIDHPDWFVSLDYCPFPAYSFNGPDLSHTNHVGIYLEDHYYSRSDAAVVFKRVDRNTGREQFMYHGNDGTNMPWNDTAQLNYLNPQVREAVIQTILDVARKFPIIRFDAAMTLAKKHFQRLWYPEPGTGGAIPSRAGNGLTRAQFDEAVPVEFWREVVDRVAQEVPDTLLLAEAFWLMEGFFVRTLGMHRVYNSAFMNMLRNEDNANYRLVIKNTLEFDPEILKRYVNFMNNPDERTSAEQFGRGDKYFGICALLSTLPGLPMFGHGQLEGFSEKYGMEFRRALWDEKPDPDLIRRHEAEISPLLHQRHLFANVDHFLLYDLFTADDSVNEDVFAFSNGQGNKRALVIFHNRYASTEGWIKQAVAYSVKSPSGERQLVQQSLADGLGLHPDPQTFVIFKDQHTRLEYLHHSRDIAENGLFFHLDAYQYHTFMEIYEVQADAWHPYEQLNSFLGGRGVPSIQEALQDLFLAPVQTPFRQLVNQSTLELWFTMTTLKPGSQLKQSLDDITAKTVDLFHGISFFTNLHPDESLLDNAVRRLLKHGLRLPFLAADYPIPSSRQYETAARQIGAWLLDDRQSWAVLFGWLCVHHLGALQQQSSYATQSRAWFDEWRFGKILTESYRACGFSDDSAWQMVNLIKILISQQDWYVDPSHPTPLSVVESWLKDPEVSAFLNVNRFEGILYYNKEGFNTLIKWLGLVAVLKTTTRSAVTAAEVVETILSLAGLLQSLKEADETSTYQVQSLLTALI